MHNMKTKQRWAAALVCSVLFRRHIKVPFKIQAHHSRFHSPPQQQRYTILLRFRVWTTGAFPSSNQDLAEQFNRSAIIPGDRQNSKRGANQSPWGSLAWKHTTEGRTFRVGGGGGNGRFLVERVNPTPSRRHPPLPRPRTRRRHPGPAPPARPGCARAS